MYYWRPQKQELLDLAAKITGQPVARSGQSKEVPKSTTDFWLVQLIGGFFLRPVGPFSKVKKAAMKNDLHPELEPAYLKSRLRVLERLLRVFVVFLCSLEVLAFLR